MKANSVIKTVMKNRSLTQKDLTTLLQTKSQSAVSGALNRDMKISTLLRFLSILDCQLIIKDNTTGEDYKITN
jgi:antitoxin component HigA of HigAB toxin-antitoxin module